MAFILTSPAFIEGGSVPTKYTCEGANVSPPLQWSGAPVEAKSFALIVEDPDAPDPKAPKRVFVHWVVYNLAATVLSLAEGGKAAKEGKNDWGKVGYAGPCPPIGRHRYIFRVIALDSMLEGLHEPTRQELDKAMQGKIVGEARLVGMYEKLHQQRARPQP